MRKVPSWTKTIGNVAYLFSIKSVYCEWFVYNQCFHHCKCVTVLPYHTYGYFTLMYSFLFHLTNISKHNNLSFGKSLFSFFFKRTSRHQVEKKWLVILFDTVISRQHSERELVKAIELFLGWFEELLLTKHPTFCIRCGHKIGEPSLYFKSITLHLHGVNEWIPLESFDYWKVHWGLLQQNSDSWRHTLVCIDEYKKNCTGIISQDFSVN